MRPMLVLSAFICVTSAHASFELVMVADRGTKSVHRYDGNSGVYLGQFGNGFLQNPMSMALDKANNRVFVADQVGTGDGSVPGRVRVWTFNYNTGEYLGNFQTGFNYRLPQISYRNGVIAIGHDINIVDFYTTTGNASPGFSWFGAPGPASLAVDGTGNYWSVEGSIVRSRNSANVQSVFTMSSAVASTGSASQRQLAISGNRALAVGAISFSTFNLSGLSTATTANILSTTSLGNYTQINGAGFGHGDIGYIAGVQGTTGQLSRVLYSERLVLQTFGSGQLSEPRSIAVVTAPEPGTLVAMSLGGLALLRRRRKG